MGDPLVEYGALLDAFLAGELSADDFQTEYLVRFKNEQRMFGEPLFLLLDRLFADVDSFTADATLLATNPDFSIDGHQLRERVSHTAAQLREWRRTGIPGSRHSCS